MNRVGPLFGLLAVLGAWTLVVERPRRPAATAPAARPPAQDLAGAAPLWGLPLDLNRAGVADLEALPGIGPVRAARIVELRARRGGRFTQVDELLDVPGVGPATLGRLRAQVTVGGAE